MLANNMPAVGDFAAHLNGHKIPETYADQIIKFRVPFSIPGELVVQANTTATAFNESTFRHALDKPFEIWRMHVELTGFNVANGVTTFPDVQPLSLDRRIRLRMEDEMVNQVIFKSPHLVSTLVTFNAHTWEWDVPYTITTAQGFAISVDAQAFPTICVPVVANCDSLDPLVITDVRVEIALQGYLIVIRPASDSR